MTVTFVAGATYYGRTVYGMAEFYIKKRTPKFIWYCHAKEKQNMVSYKCKVEIYDGVEHFDIWGTRVYATDRKM